MIQNWLKKNVLVACQQIKVNEGGDSKNNPKVGLFGLVSEDAHANQTTHRPANDPNTKQHFFRDAPAIDLSLLLIVAHQAGFDD